MDARHFPQCLMTPADWTLFCPVLPCAALCRLMFQNITRVHASLHFPENKDSCGAQTRASKRFVPAYSRRLPHTAQPLACPIVPCSTQWVLPIDKKGPTSDGAKSQLQWACFTIPRTGDSGRLGRNEGKHAMERWKRSSEQGDKHRVSPKK